MWLVFDIDFRFEEETEATDDSVSFFEDQFEIAADVFEDVLTISLFRLSSSLLSFLVVGRFQVAIQ